MKVPGFLAAHAAPGLSDSPGEREGCSTCLA
jgi:hypothetical protein